MTTPQTGIKLNRKTGVLGLVWLFHLSAIVGISLGYEQWFVERTPLNLIIIVSALALTLPMNSIQKWLGFLVFFVVGVSSEYLGVQYGLIYGEYTYGANLGPKLGGVPFLIGINWAVVVTISATIASHLVKNRWIKALVGTAIMLFLDLFMEPVAPIFDFWTFDGGTAPLQNYIGWFGVGLLLQLLYPYFFKQADRKAAYHLYLAQLVFFAYFTCWYTLVQ